MNKITKMLAAFTASAALTASFAGCGLVKDVSEREAVEAKQKAIDQMSETVLVINDDIKVEGAYYSWIFSTNYNNEYSAIAAEKEADSAADSAADSSADSAAAPEVDVAKVKEDTKNQIAEIKLAYAKAVEAGVKLSDADNDAIKSQIEQMKSQISQQGVSYSDYLNLMGSDSKTVEQIIKEEYMGNLYFATFAKDKYVTAKHILIEYGDEEGKHTKEEAQKLAEEIKAKLDDGEDFDKLMNEKSEDPGLASNPAGYTFAKDGSMVPEFETAAFALKEGEISDIIAVDSEGYKGFHILKRCPVELSGVASALSSSSDAELNAKIEAEKTALTKDVKIEETDKIAYYEEMYNK